MTDQLERWQVIDHNFRTRIKSGQLPNKIDLSNFNIVSKQELIRLFTEQLTTRHIDIQARVLKQKNLSYYTIASAGHENNIALSYFSELYDPALLHYRSSAFMLERASKQGVDKLEAQIIDQLRSLIASKNDPVCNGRHKVLGSVELNVPPQTSTIASHLPKALGLALSINQNNILKTQNNITNKPNKNSIVICSFGDASFNHSTAQGGLNAAKILSYENIPLPLIYVCEDNKIGISVKTPHNWISSELSNNTNIRYISCNGLNILDVLAKSKSAVHTARVLKQPVFLHMNTVRLMGHAGSDIEQKYLTLKEIEQNEYHDPVLHTAFILIKLGYYKETTILELYDSIKNQVSNYSNQILNEPKLTDRKDIISSVIPNKQNQKMPRCISNKLKNTIFDGVMLNWQKPRNMAQAINLSLAETLAQFKNAVIFGEDVGIKGGVYSVTTGLQKYFGRKRVFDTILDEQTILGTAIGYSQNGLLPIVEIQFLAYLYNAIDQLRGEAATLSFFSSGKLANPMIIRIASFAYQKGFGGHFHNDNAFACIREIPGIIIAAPSSAIQAVKIWRTMVKLCYSERRICVFMEPIALYFTRDLYNDSDNKMLINYPEYKEHIGIGEITVTDFISTFYNNPSTDKSSCLIIISYANGHYLSLKAAKELQTKYKNIETKVIDLNWLHPLPIDNIEQAILDCVYNEKYKTIKILIVDECRKTGSISEEIMTNLYEFMLDHHLISKIDMARVVAEDSFIPLGPAANYILPSVNEIIDKAQELLELSSDRVISA